MAISTETAAPSESQSQPAPQWPWPQIDRRFPKRAVAVMSIVFYGVIVPLNWVLTRLGFDSLIVGLMNRAQARGRFAEVFHDYTPTAHDVLVCTYAKSGTNWMMQIAHQIAFRGNGEYAHIHDVISWPDMPARRGRRMAIALTDTSVIEASPTKLRVIKTHLAARYVPYNSKARYLVVLRDPKEVVVSSYHFARGIAGPLMPSFDAWVDLFLTKRFPLSFGSSWAEHAAGYWALRNEPNVLVVFFRDMKRDLAGAVSRVADVLGVPLTSAESSAVVERSAFSYMSGIEHKFTPIPKGALPWGDGLKMMREGQVGRSGELLSPEQQRRIDAHFAAELAELGSDLPYAALTGASSLGGERSSQLQGDRAHVQSR
jgi:Sulfotransferase domain